MSSKTFPSTGDKPTFNPNAHYEVVDHDPVPKGKKPAFNPNVKYEPIHEEQPTPKPEKQEQPFKPVNDWLTVQQPEFTPIVPGNEVNEHTIKTSEAAERVKGHLQDIDQSVHDLIYEKKKDVAGREKSQELALNPSEGGPVNFQAQQLAQKGNRDAYVSPIEIQSFKDGMNQNQVMARQALDQKAKHLTKTDPAQSAQLKSDIYRMDRQSEPEKDKKVTANIEKINKGELDYDVVNGTLTKPVGFFGGIIEGYKEKDKAFDDFNIYLSGNEAEVIKRLNKKISHDPDEPMIVGKEGFANILPGGEGGMMVGGQPLKPLVAGAVAGIVGGPHAGAAAMGLLSAPEMYKLGYANALPQNYAAIKNQHPGISDADAYHQADELANKQASVDAATGMAMGVLGSSFAFKPTGLGANLLQKSIGSALKQVGETGAKKTLEGLGVGAFGATGQIVKNLMAQKAGLPVETTEGVYAQLKAGVQMTLGLTMAAKVSGLLKPKTYNELFQGLSKQPKEVIDANLESLQQTGHITPEEAQKVQVTIDEHKKLDSQIPEDVPASDRLKVQAKIKERDALEAKLETTHKAYHPEIKEQIKKLDEEIVNISKGSERGDLQKLIDAEHKSGNIEGFVTETLKDASEQDLKTYFKEISEQAHDPNSEAQTIATFGENIVNKAKELYPAPKEPTVSVTYPKKTGTETTIEGVTVIKPEVESSKGVSVIRPGEIKQPETIIIKPKEQPSEIAKGLVGSDVEDIDLPDDFASKNGKGIKVGRQVRYDNVYDAAEDMGIITKTTKPLFDFLRRKNIKVTISNKDGGPVEGMYTSSENHLRIYKKNANWGFIHESIHAAIDKLGLSKDKKFINELRYIGDEIKEKYKLKKGRIVEKYGAEFDSIIYQTIRNGNEEELITYYLTNKKFREFADEVGVGEDIRKIIPKEISHLRPQENAIPIESPDAVHVGGTSGDSQLVGEGISESKEPAGTQETGGRPPQEESINPGKEGVGEPMQIGITHRQMDAIAEEFGLPTYEKSPEKVTEWDQQAAKKLQEPDALDNLFTKLRNAEVPDHVETRMMLQYMGDLMAKIEKDPYNRTLQDQVIRTKDLFNIAGRLQGKSLQARKGSIPAEETMSDFLIRDREVNKAPLTDEDITISKGEYEALKAVNDAIEEKAAKDKEAQLKKKAEKVVQDEVRKTKKQPNKDYTTERSKIIDDLKKKWDASKGKLSATFIPYADRLIEIAPDVIKLMRSFVEQGVSELPALISKIHTTIKDHIDGISEKDVHNIIAGEYNGKKPSRSQLAQQVFDLRREAALINELEQLENGQVPASKNKQRQRNQKIEALRKQIKELKDEMGLNDKADAEKLSSLKARYKKQIADLEKKIAAGDYGPDVKPEPIVLDKEAVDLKDIMIKLKLDREARLAKKEYQNRTNFQIAKDIAADVLDTSRAAATNPDMSFFGRHGIKYLVTHPIKGPKLFWESFLQAKSQKRYDRWLYDMHNSRAWELIEKSGLAVLDPNTLHASKREEQWRSKLIHMIPVVKQIVKWSERAFTSAANMARADWFMEGVNVLRKQGKTFENSPEEYKAWASAVNNMTGRGGLGALEPVVGQLAIPFWSPRLIASNVNLFLNPVYYTKMPKTARIMLIKNMAQYVVSGVGFLMAAKALGADVEYDPRSSDFGKIKVGNTRYDIWGGASQYIRVLSQIMTASRKSGGSVSELKPRQLLTTGTNLVRTKLSPVWGFVIDAKLGENVVGEKVEWKDALKIMIPMLWNDIQDAKKDSGPDGAAVSGLLSFIGIGAQTYGAKPGSTSAPSPGGAKKTTKQTHTKPHKTYK